MKFFLLIIMICLSACSSKVQEIVHTETTSIKTVTPDPKGNVVFSKDMQILTKAHTNNNMPLAIDLVFVSHPALAGKLNTMTAQQFFHEREQIKQDNPRFIKIRSLELIPGNSTPSFAVPYPRKDVSAALLFARFNNQFPNRWRLHPADTIRVYAEQITLKILSHEDGTPDDKIKIPVKKPSSMMDNVIILDS